MGILQQLLTGLNQPKPSGSATEGQRAEYLAAVFLQRQGLKLLQKNYRCRFGEIDLIMQSGNIVIFVEVRLRQNPSYGGPAASITTAKQHKLLATAQHYLQCYHPTPACRFDVVLLRGLDQNKIEWIQNAINE